MQRTDYVSPQQFQFHSGSIKRPISLLKVKPLKPGFNSIVVRLKEFALELAATNRHGFNSIVVRLKDRRPTRRSLQSAPFQFHSGSIKSQHRLLLRGLRRLFQFHSGSIKSACVQGSSQSAPSFQFHSGSIKSYWGGFRDVGDNTVSIP